LCITVIYSWLNPNPTPTPISESGLGLKAMITQLPLDHLIHIGWRHLR